MSIFNKVSPFATMFTAKFHSISVARGQEIAKSIPEVVEALPVAREP